MRNMATKPNGFHKVCQCICGQKHIGVGLWALCPHCRKIYKRYKYEDEWEYVKETWSDLVQSLSPNSIVVFASSIGAAREIYFRGLRPLHARLLDAILRR